MPRPTVLYILVMGLTGAGKSTFISVITGIEDISVGVASQLDGGNATIINLLLALKLTLPPVTEEVQDYILCYNHKGTLYEIHLIDSPGFDDGDLGDAQVLSRIATYVNTNYKLKQTLAGVLYLHDITKAKVGRAGLTNLRMLENMIGMEKIDNCTLVTTKWGCTTNSQDELEREKTLRAEKNFFFGSMLQNTQHANMERFDPKTQKTALDIITPFLEKTFTPQISCQMADPCGPNLALGETEAGKVVADNVEKRAQTMQQPEKVRHAQEVLSQRFDEELFEEFKQKRKVLRRKTRKQRSGCWIMRTSIVAEPL